MTWSRLADEFPRHPKVIAAGLEGHALIIGGLCYANGYLTRGIIREDTTQTLSPLVKPLRVPKVVQTLVELRVWHTATSARDCAPCLEEAGRSDALIRLPMAGELLIHDFAEFAEDADAIKERRRAKVERTRRWRHRGVTPEDTDGVTESVTPGVTDSVTAGVTETVTAKSTVTLPSRAGASRTRSRTTSTPENQTLAATSAAIERRDLVFEALCEVESIDPSRINDAERGRINRATKLAKQGQHDGDDILRAWKRWPDVMPPDATCTAMGVVNHISQLLNGAPRSLPRPTRDRAQEIYDNAMRGQHG